MSTQLPSMMGWMEKLLLGGKKMGWVVQTVQRVEEVYLQVEVEKSEKYLPDTVSLKQMIYCGV